MEQSDEDLMWVPVSNGGILSGSVKGGYDANGEKFYIGRAEVAPGYIVPGIIVPKMKGCVIVQDDNVIVKQDYESLVQVAPTEWASSEKGQEIPSGAIPGGNTSDGKTLYFGRIEIPGQGINVGQVNPNGELQVEVDGEVKTFDKYFVLVDKRKRNDK